MIGKIKVFDTPEELEALVRLLHDEYFNVEDVRFDSQKAVVEIPFGRVFHDGQHKLIRNWLIYRTYEHEILRCVLRIKNVEDLEIIDEDNMVSTSFCDVHLNDKDGELVIECCENGLLRMRISNFSAEFEEIGYQRKTKVSYLGFLEMSSGHVYE